MLETFIDHFDAIIIFDKDSGKMIYQNQEFSDLTDDSIANLDDLNKFFKQLLNANSTPIFEVITVKKKQYLAKRKLIDKYILYHFEDNNYYTNVLKQIEQQSSIDDLTLCYNKKETELIFKRMLSSYLRYSETYFTVLMLDLDHFKKVNDTYGHLAGDYILKETTKIIKKHLRESDIFGRVGGEEFIILLTHTKTSGALKISNKILDIIRNHQFEYNGKLIPIRVSIGMTSILKNDSYHSIVDRVDKALYKAKSNGRDRIEYL